MGLDMYLRKRIYIGANHEHNNVKGSIKLTSGKENKPIKVDLSKVTYILEEAAYWRKQNQIHNWFVNNVQDGIDDCREYFVSNDQLKELVELCKKDIEYLSTLNISHPDPVYYSFSFNLVISTK